MAELISIQEAREALTPISTALAADGYELSVQEGDPEILKIRITATPAACEDCLAPRSVVQPMIESLLADRGIAVPGLELSYPEKG